MVEACVMRNGSFHRHNQDLPTAGLVPAALLVVYVIIRLIGS
jgi:hypothetical protein